MDESALQAWLGDKKYGEKGMDALRKAGRKHVGKAKMQSIRAKFSNKEEEGVAEDSSENKYSNLSNRGVNRGINRAADDFTRMMDLDQAESPHSKTQHQQDTKQRLKTKPMAGPKGHLPEQAMAEDLDANQKRVGQLGPTEKVKNNNIGKLVGANENFINSTSQAVTTEEDEMDEGTHTQHDRDLNPNDYERPNTDFSRDPIEAGTDRIHQKISNMLKKLSKPEDKPLDKNKTSLGSTVLDEMDKSQTPPGRDGDPRPGPEHVATPITQEKMVNHALDALARSMAKKDDKKEVKEGQEDLDRILQIMNHRR